jgi:integrase/recombinase XerD
MYQVYFINDKKASSCMLNQHVCALRFLYRNTLGKEWVIRHIPCPRIAQTLPVVLSSEGIERFFEQIHNLKHRAILLIVSALLAADFFIASLSPAEPGELGSSACSR